jgi:hypothetical protein
VVISVWEGIPLEHGRIVRENVLAAAAGGSADRIVRENVLAATAGGSANLKGLTQYDGGLDLRGRARMLRYLLLLHPGELDKTTDK